MRAAPGQAERYSSAVTAIEVKSGRRKGSLPGLDSFVRAHGGALPLLVGANGVPLEEFPYWRAKSLATSSAKPGSRGEVSRSPEPTAN